MKHWRTASIGMWAVAAALTSLWLVAPGRAAENGAQARSVARFDRVRCEGAFTVRITAGARAQAVSVAGDPATVSRVITTVDGETLTLAMRSGTSSFFHSPVITIAVPVLRGYANDGAGSATITGVNGRSLSLANAGAARITVAGHASTLAIDLDGVGSIDTLGLDARDATVTNNGVGRIDVRASGALSISVNGVGSVRYAGNPTSVDRQVNGIGSIDRL